MISRRAAARSQLREATIEAVVTRADGSRADLGVVSRLQTRPRSPLAAAFFFLFPGARR